MYMEEVFSAVLAALCAVGFIIFLASKDKELPMPRWWLAIGIGLVTGVFCWWVNYRNEQWIWYNWIFVAYMALIIYTDAWIHKLYVLPNYFALGGVLIMTLVISIQRGYVNPIPLLVAGVFLMMGYLKLFGKGDGYALAIIMLYEGILWDNNPMAMMVTVLGGCGIFVIYSIVVFCLKRMRSAARTSFWKEAHPLLPSMGVGLLVCTWLVT